MILTIGIHHDFLFELDLIYFTQIKNKKCVVIHTVEYYIPENEPSMTELTDVKLSPPKIVAKGYNV